MHYPRLPTSLLSNREAEVTRLRLEGKSTNEIAAILGISFTTVRAHINNTYTKLHCDHDLKSVEEVLKKKAAGA